MMGYAERAARSLLPRLAKAEGGGDRKLQRRSISHWEDAPPETGGEQPDDNHSVQVRLRSPRARLTATQWKADGDHAAVRLYVPDYMPGDGVSGSAPWKCCRALGREHGYLANRHYDPTGWPTELPRGSSVVCPGSFIVELATGMCMVYGAEVYARVFEEAK